jgi:hypothetical protein
MNFLKKGPELKLSEIKVPGFVKDLYYDLKDRHLLPVAAILVVGIFAVPIAISDSGSEELPPGAGGPEAAISGAGENTGTPVARAAPGLRKYERRLEFREAENPFSAKFQQSSGSSSGGSGAGQAEGGEEGGGSPESTLSPEPFEPSGGGGGGGGTPDGSPGRLTYYSYAIDVRITNVSEDKKPEVRNNLPELTMLPSRETPAIVYMGSTADGKKAVMTVSSDVQAIFGDAKCVLGSQTCQMLVMEEGLPQTFVYGGAEKTYKIEIIKIDLVESDKVNKAPLGEDEKKKKGEDGKSERTAGLSNADQR